MTEYHAGRSWWPGKWIEDACPCPKAPCGLVPLWRADPECPEHALGRGKSLREIHTDADCPARVDGV